MTVSLLKESETVFTPEHSWAPAFYTRAVAKDSPRGDAVIEFTERFLVATEGFRAGYGIVLAEWQKWLLRSILEETEEGLMRWRRGIVMLPRKNGKTFLASILVLYNLLCAPANSEIYSAASSKDTSKIVYKYIQKWLEANPALKQVLKVKLATNEIINTMTGTFYRPLSSDGSGAHGFNPYFVVADELHTWKNTELWSALTTGSGARPEAMIMGITTAGGDVDNSLLGDLYKLGKVSAERQDPESQFGFWAWEASEEDDPGSEEVWEKANPNLAEGLMDRGSFKASLQELASTNIQEFLRYHLNLWVRLGGEHYISPSAWQKAGLKDAIIPEGSEITVGFDGSQSGDSTGIVIQDYKTGLLQVWEVWEKPEGPGAEDFIVMRADIEESLERLHKKYAVKAIWADESYWQQDIKMWAKVHDWAVTAIPQNRARMTPMGLTLVQDILELQAFHPDDELLTRYVMNASLTEEGGYRKATRKVKIDLLVCSILANGARNQIKNKPKQAKVWFSA